MYQEGSTVYWIIITSFVMPLLLSAILIWFFYAYQKKKHQSETAAKDALLREQALIIQNQNAIEAERNRIASDMHDDLGSGLTTIRYLSEKVMSMVKSDNEMKEIRAISEHSNALITNMSEIIWAMNSRFDTADQLFAYIRRFAGEFLEQHNLALKFDIIGDGCGDISGEKRRNVVLVVKEILHNAVKYSGAKAIEIDCVAHPTFSIYLREVGGKGFDPEEASKRGNGLYNVQKRLDNMGGKVLYLPNKDHFGIKIIW